jgi:hypothetical protein
VTAQCWYAKNSSLTACQIFPLLIEGSQNKSSGQEQNQMKDSNGWEIVFTYLTKEALKDGYLVKVNSETSKEVGIKFPVYITLAAWICQLKYKFKLLQ